VAELGVQSRVAVLDNFLHVLIVLDLFGIDCSQDLVLVKQDQALSFSQFNRHFLFLFRHAAAAYCALPNTGRINRHDGPEDGSLQDRCLTLGLPEFGSAYGGSFRRIVQTPGGVTMYYDVGQGQGWQRNIVMDGRPHLPAGIRQWYGDSRGRFEGDALVIDVTNFSPKTDVLGARQNLHLVERWRRTGPNTIEYAVTVDDPTVWTRPWTAKLEYTRQSEEQNRIYYEPRCVEGNYGHPALMLGARVEELAYAEGRGPHPATKDNATDFVGVEDDPFQ